MSPASSLRHCASVRAQGRTAGGGRGIALSGFAGNPAPFPRAVARQRAPRSRRPGNSPRSRRRAGPRNRRCRCDHRQVRGHGFRDHVGPAFHDRAQHHQMAFREDPPDHPARDLAPPVISGIARHLLPRPCGPGVVMRLAEMDHREVANPAAAAPRPRPSAANPSPHADDRSRRYRTVVATAGAARQAAGPIGG